MEKRETDQLPDIDWMLYILDRNHTAFHVNKDDDEATARKKEEEYVEFLDFYDCYVDKMLPTAAGPKKWNAAARHFQPLSTSVLPNGRYRVHPSSEALVALLYANGRKKWMAMRKREVSHPEDKTVIRWSKNKPLENPDYETPYSDATAGQSKYGGWNKEGRKLYGRYGIIVKNARANKKDTCLKIETECFQRLYEANKEIHEKKKKTKKRKYQADGMDEENDEELEWV
jgi:hypothetical protein